MNMVVVMMTMRIMFMMIMLMMVVGIVASMIVAVMIVIMRVVVVIFRRKKIRFVFQNFIEIEAAEAEHLIKRDLATLRRDDFSEAIDGADAVLNRFELILADKIGLVEEDDVGEGNLFFGFFRILEAQRQMQGIDHCDDAVEFGARRDIGVGEEGLRDRPRVGEACGFD